MEWLNLCSKLSKNSIFSIIFIYFFLLQIAINQHFIINSLILLRQEGWKFKQFIYLAVVNSPIEHILKATSIKIIPHAK